MSSFILSCSLQIFLRSLLGGLGKYVEIDESCFSRCKCNCGRLCVTACLYLSGVGIRGTCLAPVADRSAEKLFAIIKACILPSTTMISDFCGYNICLLNEVLTHHAVDCSIFVAWCSHKYDGGHMEACQHSPQALLRKQSKMCDKQFKGFSISWVWWCSRMNCKALCLVYYYSVGPYSPFTFSNWMFSSYPKNNYNTIYV